MAAFRPNPYNQDLTSAEPKRVKNGVHLALVNPDLPAIDELVRLGVPVVGDHEAMLARAVDAHTDASAEKRADCGAIRAAYRPPEHTKEHRRGDELCRFPSRPGLPARSSSSSPCKPSDASAP